MNFHRLLSAEVFLSELCKGRTEMSVSVAWATVRTDRYEKPRRAGQRYLQCASGYALSSARIAPQYAVKLPQLSHTFLLNALLIVLIKQCLSLPETPDSSFQHLRTACYGFTIWSGNIGAAQCHIVLYMILAPRESV